MRRLLTLTLAVAVAVGLAACGLGNPYQTRQPQTSRTTASPPSATTTAPDSGDPAPERGGTIPKGAQAAQRTLADQAARATPQAALERYAQIYLNWTAKTVVAIQHRLAAISLDQARAQAQQAAATAGRDSRLSASGITNSGHLVALAPGRAAAAGQWVIVTSETTRGLGAYQGLPATLHIIYARVAHAPQGWVVTGWQPQN